MATLDPPLGVARPVEAARSAQPWIGSPAYDSGLLILPGLIAMIIAFMMPVDSRRVPPEFWLALVAIIDTAHVWSTLFRTYLDREELAMRRRVYLLVPACCFAVGFALYNIDPLWFWRAVIYLAFFHFIRQQYGFMMIYGRFERGLPAWCKRIDQLAVYIAMLHAFIGWHFLMDKEFFWFATDDFLRMTPPGWAMTLNHTIAAVMVLVWAGKEVWLYRQGHPFNLPRAMLLAVSNLIAIAALYSDYAFAATLFVFHAVPYMGLTFLFERKRAAVGRSPLPGLFRHLWPAAAGFVALLLLLVFIEEGLWDSLVWREHALLSGFDWLEALVTHPPLWWIVPLLALPQTTHYVLDAVIWRRDLAGSDWAKILFSPPPKAAPEATG